MSTDNETETNNSMEALFEASREAHAPATVDALRGDHERAPLLVVPDRMTVVDPLEMLNKRLPVPLRARGFAKLCTLDSFIAHVKRTRSVRERCVVFVDPSPSAPSMLSLYDYDAGTASPGWREHGARYSFPLSRAWKAWADRAGRPMSQADFAAFLEDRAHEVVDPKLPGAGEAAVALGRLDLRVATPAEMLTASRGLAATVEVSVESSTVLNTGEVRFVYGEKLKGQDGQKLTIPGGFVVALPVFEGDREVHALPVRLRFKMGRDGAAPTWTLVPLGADDVVRDAIAAARERVAKEVEGLEVFEGSPEA